VLLAYTAGSTYYNNEQGICSFLVTLGVTIAVTSYALARRKWTRSSAPQRRGHADGLDARRPDGGDGNPSCVAGGYGHIKDATVTLTDPVPLSGGKQVWSKIQIAPAPPGSSDGLHPLATNPT